MHKAHAIGRLDDRCISAVRGDLERHATSLRTEQIMVMAEQFPSETAVIDIIEAAAERKWNSKEEEKRRLQFVSCRKFVDIFTNTVHWMADLQRRETSHGKPLFT